MVGNMGRGQDEERILEDITCENKEDRTWVRTRGEKVYLRKALCEDKQENMEAQSEDKREDMEQTREGKEYKRTAQCKRKGKDMGRTKGRHRKEKTRTWTV
jgi:hypothetical protein